MAELKLVDLIYRWKVNEAVERLERKLDNEFYVTDLVYCPLKYRYQKLYKELTVASSVNPLAILGELAHYGIEKILARILGAENVKVEVEFNRDVEVDGSIYVVKGRVDAVVGDCVVEIKTSRSDASIPQGHHLLQTRIYLWLTGYRKAVLLYVTAKRLAEFSIDKPVAEEEIANLIRGVLAGTPAPRYSWECEYCAYSTVCPSKRSLQ